jgi:small-conductance mechanosensitive channel
MTVLVIPFIVQVSTGGIAKLYDAAIAQHQMTEKFQHLFFSLLGSIIAFVAVVVGAIMIAKFIIDQTVISLYHANLLMLLSDYQYCLQHGVTPEEYHTLVFPQATKTNSTK